MTRWRNAAVLLFTLLAACTRAAGNSAWGEPHRVRIGILNDPTSLNPLFGYYQRQIDVNNLYCETLVGVGPKNQVVPLLAARVPSRENGDVSRDGLTITYHLRRGARFADGVPVTSADVAFTYRAIMDPRNPVTDNHPYERIAALTTPDAYTVRIRLRRPWAAAVNELFAQSDFSYGILPAHAFSSTYVARAAWNDRPFGSGPFRVVRWVRGSEIVLEPNPYAWRKPHVRGITVAIYADGNAVLNALRTHAIDVANIDYEQIETARGTPGLRVVAVPMNGTDYLQFNASLPPTNDPLVRRALIAAIDRERIRIDALHNLERPANTEEPRVLWSHDDSVRQTPYDPKRAAAFFAHRRVRVDFAYESSSDQARRVATMLVAPAPAGVLYSGRFNLAYLNFFGGSDPESSEPNTCERRAPAGPNMSRWCSPAYDRDFAAQQSEHRRAGRARIFGDMQRLIANAAIYDFIGYQVQYIGVNPALRGFAPNMLYEYSNAEDWDV
jgi:ABC-type transport system substrate-binding protein